jgi:predicted GNAT superfamily acetyltransferase
VLAPGVPTDRLLVEWELHSPRVVEKAEAAAGTANRQPLLRFRAMPTMVLERDRTSEPGPFAAPGRVRLSCRDAAVAAEVPSDIGALRERPDLIVAWQSALRLFFDHYFTAGYAAVRFMTGDASCYVLERL